MDNRIETEIDNHVYGETIVDRLRNRDRDRQADLGTDYYIMR
jgi:hypothetical protein